WLKLKRKALDLTREQLAERVGYSAATIRKIEDEERYPSAQVVERLAGFFKIPQNELEDFLRFARGDLKSVPVEIDENVPWRASSKATRSNIPATTTSLIAREKEIALVREYLSRDDIRLVTLMGPPGIGKTRLSIEVARASLHDFPDGVFFVSLALVDDPDSISSTIIPALGFMESGRKAPEDQLKESIGEKQMLIVLDNCEHLVEFVASISSQLLSACPGLKLLTTSRESFRIPGEWLYPIPAFDIPTESEAIDLDNASDFPALMLFVERARAVRPDFKLTADNIQTIAAICAHLDGLPLVIELIAARMRLMSPAALLERLSGQFVLTADGMRAPSERQKTLKNAIEWSYQLLSAQEQKLFVNLSVFSGGFTLKDAETIFARTVTEKSVPELLTLLLDKSLIRRVANETDEDQYAMLVTIQEYALERLRDSDEETKIRDWHLAYFLGIAEKAAPELHRHNQLDWIDRLRTRRDNLRTALDWAIETERTESALQLVRNLDWFWHLRSDYVEGAHWVLNVLKLPDVPLYPEAHAGVLVQLQHYKHLLGSHFSTQLLKGGGTSFAEQALSIARARNDANNSAGALAMIGLNLITEKNFAEAQSALEESRTLFQQSQDEWGYAYAVFLLGWKSFVQNDLAAALTVIEQAFTIFEKLGERHFMCVALRYIGVIHIKQGNSKAGLEALKESLRLARQLDIKYEIAAAFYRLGEAAQYLGSSARTVSLFWAAKTAYDTINAGMWTQGMDAEFEPVLDRCRAELGEAAFAQAVEQGRAMTMEQAVAYALENSS
ncbi:MAG TPA: helix-turn-helix domain-containing protein, partial [Anaerolineales bacterium]|nr:helix-turn-helix domain-containing protein [Anaerolineales bacterium]